MRQPDELYFRVRENGAAVFRVDTENRQRRLEMNHVANVNVRNGEIKAQGQSQISEDEMKIIEAWRDARINLLSTRQIDDVHRLIDEMNILAHWIQTKAEDDEMDQFSDDLLMAMHDLRGAVVKSKAKAMKKD